jgi:hypothetical protein
MDYQELAQKTGMVLVEIDGSGVKAGRMYADKVTGAQRPIPGSQTAYIWQGGKYPVEISIDVDDAKGPLRPGFYFLGGAIFASGDYGRVRLKGFRDLRLVECGLVFDSVALGSPKTVKAA